MMLLLLGGTTEARHLAVALANQGIAAVVSLAGATRSPADLPLPTRHGGFGGADPFKSYLDDRGITAILDATHPFAQAISARTARIAAERGLPYLQVLRPEWAPGPGDRWTMVAGEDQAADHIPGGSTVFLATGRQTLDRFSNLADCRLICRQIDPPDRPFPFANGQFLIGRPPFSVADERALFEKLGVDWLIVKNAGGQASKTKLTAARELGIPVIMVKRPPPAMARPAQGVQDALTWVRNLP